MSEITSNPAAAPAEPRKPHMGELERERILCQMKAFIRATWPEEFGASRAKLTLLQGGKGCAS
jgi:hypothetical protein